MCVVWLFFNFLRFDFVVGSVWGVLFWVSFSGFLLFIVLNLLCLFFKVKLRNRSIFDESSFFLGVQALEVELVIGEAETLTISRRGAATPRP